MLLAGALAIMGPAASASAKALRLVAFGDSLTAGYMLPSGEGFAPKLEAALRAQGHDVTVVDAGVSGDTTTTDGLARLDWTLADGADAVIVELGANDMLRGLDPKIPRDNLGKILASLKSRHIPVLLAGMRATPSSAPTTPPSSIRSIPPWPNSTACRSIRSSSKASWETARSICRTGCTPTPGVSTRSSPTSCRASTPC